MNQPAFFPPKLTATHITTAPLEQFLGPYTITPPPVAVETFTGLLRSKESVEITVTDIDFQTAALLMGCSVLELLNTPQNRDARRRATLTPRTKGRHL